MKVYGSMRVVLSKLGLRRTGDGLDDALRAVLTAEKPMSTFVL